MKKIIIFLFIAALITGIAFAQERPARQRVEPPKPQTITGILKLEKGSVAVQSGENVYMAPMLTRYIGFINGLREDARVSIEGFVFRNMIHPIKATIGDKSYDFNMGPGFGMQNRFSFMRNKNNHFNKRVPVPGHRFQQKPDAERPDRENLRQNRRGSNRSEQG